MRLRFQVPVLLVAVSVLLVPAFPAGADHKTRPSTKNMHALGHAEHPQSFPGPISSDIAFWGDLAFHGNYDGFRIVDISAPGNPKLLNWTHCNGDQGDIVVYEDILVRSWNSPAPSSGSTCDGTAVPPGWEGVHVFDISDTSNPTVVAAVDMPCGSHTVTMAGVEAGSLIVYSNNSSGGATCDGGAAAGDFMDVIGVPLANPSGAALVHREPLVGPVAGAAPGCHDAGVILGDVNKAVCASADHTNVFDIGANATPGGSLSDPVFLFGISEPGVGQAGTNGRWHSGAFTWDGEVILLGWEPGGGLQAECEETDPPVDKSMFFYDADTGAKLGQWTLPRAQGRDENCTIHNYNLVPTTNGRYVVVSGNYQAGTWVTELTDPANPVTLGWSDPPSLGPGPFCSNTTPPGCQLGGAWSSYWYNGFIYESEITKGLNIFRFSGRETGGALKLDYLNPQTQPFSIG